MNPAYWLNSAWLLACRREARAFRRATRCVRDTQEKILRSLIRANADCRFGRENHFASIQSVADFQARVPISTWEHFAPDIDLIAAGEQRVLTSEPVLMLEPTGGSAGGAKLVPYTATLRRQFQRAIAAWIADVMTGFPKVRQGTAYWSISPAVNRPRRTDGGVPIGFESDSEYLAGWQRWVASRLLVAPPEISRIRNIDNFRYATLAYLLAAESLGLVSIWSPTFLTALIEALPTWQERIFADLHDGRLRLPAVDDEPRGLTLPFDRDRARASRLEQTLGDSDPFERKLQSCWPGLGLISCWADAGAELHVPRLRTLFPDVPLQPKGLLATEGVVTFPSTGHPGGALAIRSHFFEFVEADETVNNDEIGGEVRLADELETGRHYRVLLTTGGGLYRYDLGDLVEVVGHVGECPLLRFLGRSSQVGDLVGEKLSEAHVRASLWQAFEELGLQPDFALVVPADESPPHYLALLVCPAAAGREAELAAAIESRLHQNPQYHYARGLRQLGPLQVRLLELSPAQAWQRCEQHARRHGQKTGDVKPLVLGSAAWLDAQRFPPGRG